MGNRVTKIAVVMWNNWNSSHQMHVYNTPNPNDNDKLQSAICCLANMLGNNII